MGFSCQGVSKAFDAGAASVRALEEVDFAVGFGELVCLLGPSGCGKTTLLRLIAGLEPPDSGRVLFDDASPADLRCRLVFQEHGVFPWMTVLDNVAFALEARRVPRREREERAREFLDQLGLAGFVDHYPHQLSVGMRQRVGLGRAFLADPQILLMDEPFGALDALTRRSLQIELLRVWQEHRKTVLFVTHDIDEALRLGDRVLVMSDRPGTIRDDVAVTLPRPRVERSLREPAAHALRDRLWRSLSPETP